MNEGRDSTAMSCRFCATPNLGVNLFCVGCGRALSVVIKEAVALPNSRPSSAYIASGSGDAVLICESCAAQNPSRYLFCGSCARSLRNAIPTSVPTQVISCSESTCRECSSANARNDHFCVHCGTPLRVPQSEREVVSTSHAVARYHIQNRIRLRITLLASASLLLAPAVVLSAVAGMQWAVAPFVLALLSAAMSVGRLNRRSLTMFVSDTKMLLGGARMPGRDVHQPTGAMSIEFFSADT